MVPGEHPLPTDYRTRIVDEVIVESLRISRELQAQLAHIQAIIRESQREEEFEQQ